MSQLDTLREAGHLSAVDVHFARAMGRIGGEPRDEVLLAAALTSRQVSSGHVCFNVAGATLAELGIPPLHLVLPDRGTWIGMLRESPLVSGGERKTPLVLDEHGWLYLHRYWRHEQVLAAFIGRGVQAGEDSIRGDVLADGLTRLFPPVGDGERDWQRLAALMAVCRRFCVVSGGPGTGKTSTVVKILALLVEQAVARRSKPPHMTLVAPTGKAATRLEQSIKAAKAGLSCTDEVRDAIVESASTIHRCLGSVGGSGTVFRHNRDTPLATDVVLVDEASMVNLGLMRRLMDAMPAHARLILLGDMDQLASVEAGAVLGDICNNGGERYFSTDFAADVTALTGDAIPTDSHAPVQIGIGDCVATLHKSYRYKGDSGIAALARAMNRGDADEALAVLERYDDVSLEAPGAPGRISDALIRAAIDGYGPYLNASTPPESLRAFDHFRVLCARRTGSFGVSAINDNLVAALREHGLISGSGVHYAGRPVMVTANDYELRLFNGDVGLVLPDPNGSLRVFFVDPDGSERTFAPSRLSHHETVFAMSVHKSQGSEFDHIAVVLPDEPSLVLTRELVYTAVTRAKKTVVIHGTAEVLRQAISRRVQRQSGLRAALWGNPEQQPA